MARRWLGQTRVRGDVYASATGAAKPVYGRGYLGPDRKLANRIGLCQSNGKTRTAGVTVC
jgi:hypothetical protein